MNINSSRYDNFIAFELRPNDFSITSFNDIYIPIDKKPDRNVFLQDIVKTIARFGNEYVLEKHRNLLVTFNFGETLVHNGGSDYRYQYIVYSREINIEKDVKIDIEIAMFKFYKSLIKSEESIDKTDDLFYEDTRKNFIDNVDIKFDEANTIADEFIRKFSDKPVSKSISVLSESFTTPAIVGSTIKSSKTKNVTQDESIYEATCIYTKANFDKNVIEVKIINSDKIDSHCTNFHINDFSVMDQFKKSILSSRFINLKYQQEQSAENTKPKLIALEITPSDGPKDLLHGALREQ